MMPFLFVVLIAQQAAPPDIYQVDKLADGLYMVTTKSAGDAAVGNVAFYVSPDGVLVVDDTFEQQRRDGVTVAVAQGLVDQIRKVTDRPIRYVVNTHHHSDHAGGNATFASQAIIVAHANERKNLIAQHEAQLARTPGVVARLETDLAAARSAGDRARVSGLEEQLSAQRVNLDLAKQNQFEKSLPSLTYDSELDIHLGAEEIRLFHFGPAHTDGDTLVYFVHSKVAHWGDTFETRSHPFIDRNAGASTRAWIEFLEHGLQALDPSTRMIPGHGAIGTASDVRSVIKYFGDLRDAIKGEMKTGKSRAQSVDSVVTRFPQYKDFRPGETRFRQSLGAIYDELQAEPDRAR